MNYNICTYYVYWHFNCSFANLTNSGILAKLLAEMLRTYPHNGLNTEINALDGYAFQFTNSLNQLLYNVSAFSNIDLGECETLLKETYGIPQEMSLIFLKFEKIVNNSGETDIQYQVYNPLNYEKLNLSICTDTTKITITRYLEISDEVLELIKNIIDQGYDPFDLNDKFYREICTPYNSENGTDVLLDDREEYTYSTIMSEMTCPTGCEMQSYSLDTKYITCECAADSSGIVELDYHHISAKNAYSSLVSTLKNSNYKVMICYNLVFNFKIFCHNYGSIITLIFFFFFVLFMIYYCCKDITPLKISISKLIFEEQQKYETNFKSAKPFIFDVKSAKNAKSVKSEKSKSKKSVKNKKNQNKSTKEYNPPKKARPKRDKNDSFEKTKAKGEIKLIDILKKKKSIKNKNLPGDKESIKSDKVRKRKSIIDYQNELVIKTREQLIYQETLDGKANADAENTHSSKKLKNNEGKDFDNQLNEKNMHYDNYELNHMGYFDASDLDKRSFLRTYWSIILREHYVMFTFVSRNDYNLFYIKIERFFILICTEMTMNGMFFVHETMYKKQTGDTSFAQKIPQIIFSLLVSHAIEIILCYLGMTDVHYYEIKALPKKEKNDQRIFDILKCVKRKLIGFFIFTFLVFLFHWYFISAFCAVYQNTQLIYLRDSAISILVSLIDPFVIYAFTCLLRTISLLKCCRKKLCCFYKVSELIPIF